MPSFSFHTSYLLPLLPASLRFTESRTLRKASGGTVLMLHQSTRLYYLRIYLWLYNPLLDLVCFSSFDGGSAHRKAATCTQDDTNRINAHKHPWFEWDSKPRSQLSSVRNRSCLTPNGHCDRLTRLLRVT
jgi:hypothetical protein